MRWLLAMLVLSACGGRSPGKLTYDGHVLDPKAIVFARVSTSQNGKMYDYVLTVFSDQGDACRQYDNLGAVAQPHLGTTLILKSNRFEKASLQVPEFSAQWLDFQGVRVLSDLATAGKLTIDEAGESWGGEFELTLPKGTLQGPFTASFCPAMRDYYIGFPEAP